MCNCKSYNWGTGTEPEKILDMSKYFPGEKKEVCIDACIANSVERLWQNGIVTRGSCCGHNRTQKSIILESARDAGKAASLLAGQDFNFKAWVLADC